MDEIVLDTAGGLRVVLPEDAPARLDWRGGAFATPLVEVLDVARGRARSGSSYATTALGSALRPVARAAVVDADERGRTVRVAQFAAESGLMATTVLRSWASGGLTAWTEIENRGETPIVLEAVSSLALAAGDPAHEWDAGELELWTAESGWLSEHRWRSAPVRGELAAVDIPFHGQDPRARAYRSSSGSWSTGDRHPGGVLVRHSGGALAWQVEHNGSWYWELSEHRDGLALRLFGPTAAEHGWRIELAPGERFGTVPASIVVTGGGRDDALAALTRLRRERLAADVRAAPLPVVYNDFLNTVMGDPTTERLLPLVRAAADAGADVYCIDAGWYDLDGDWWYSVGEWTESPHRFPGGLREVTDEIRQRGMTVGLWLEPEVVGIRSAVAERMPEEAFFRRSGVRVEEHGRYHLDLSHPAARAHLDGVVDRLVRDYGIGYLKLDYNITSGPGTDLAGSAGAGLLAHCRGLLDWIDGVRGRHPGLLLENCASGGMRADYAMLARTHLQSVSDQQNPLLAAPIAAASLAAVLPEQAGIWASPQPGMAAEEVAWSMGTAILGRLYLSGRLDLLDADQDALVADALHVHRSVSTWLREAVPSWPLGLPESASRPFALRLSGPDDELLSVWLPPHGEAVLPADPAATHLVYPRALDGVSWVIAAGELRLRNETGQHAFRLFGRVRV